MRGPKPKDMIAIILTMCVTFLLFTGYEGPLTEVITLVVGYYFGHRQSGKDTGQ